MAGVLRKQLLEMAREWMQAAIEEEGAEPISPAARDSPSTPSQ